MGNSESEYDSTWEDEFYQKKKSTKSQTDRSHRSHSARRNIRAAEDMQNYRHKCRDSLKYFEGSEEHEENLYNLKFYQNQIPSQPDNVFIEEFHKRWKGDYNKLEEVPTYIQWLFPIQEPGVNRYAHVLTPKEIKLFREDREAKERLVKSYELMLNFYGIKLNNKKSGEVRRAEKWKERFENLDRNPHNNLRITRILKCLGILGFQHYQAPLVRFFLEETLENGNLPSVKRSVLDYFIFSVLDRSERKELIRFAFEKFEPKEEFVWCPKVIQIRLSEEMNEEHHMQSSTPFKLNKKKKKKDGKNQHRAK